MPIERHPISVSQFCDLLAIDPARFAGIERGPRGSSTLTILMEPDMQTTSTIPQLTKGGKRIGAKGGGKKGC